MAPKYQSEIRQGEIRELALRVKDGGALVDVAKAFLAVRGI